MATALVVDDHLDSCHMLVRLVRLLGHRADCVTSGADALAAVDAAVPDLVVLDVVMKGMGGLDVLARLRSAPATRDVPVVMYSAHDDDGLRARAMELGATAYLVKSAALLDDVEGTLRKMLAD